ncbi:homeobox-leucine zipper protein ROC3 [Macadamia integrifolia]|uniref:homeobox-leucine zipper protein ROC3 n=1 Tax=Macadamia integrifolia TaxID=60698 RepID=UPI001C4E52E9|nr:homeobox-leucine zipper protein ROC3 [Macadamia integrifolia]
MYGGDCQVMSYMGGSIVTSDQLFSSPIRNPNLNFMPNMGSFNHFPTSIIPKDESTVMMMTPMMMRGKDEEIESRSGSGGQGEEVSGDDQEQEQVQEAKRKRYHRHTAKQIQQMEALFKECPHPDDKQRLKLSQELGLKPRQVKFWFQNRRTQLKAQQDRTDNVMLRAENDNLKKENFRLQAALRNIMCPNCGGAAILGEVSYEEQHLRVENARLKEELERISCLVQRCGGRPIQALAPPAQPMLLPSLDLEMGIYNRSFHDSMGNCNEMVPVTPSLLPEIPHIAGGGLIMEHEKPLALELAMTAANELVKMCQAGEPLWGRNSNDVKEVLNLEEHVKMFPWPNGFKRQQNEMRTEASRGSALVIMNSITLVESFLDANKWMELFPSIVTRAKTVQIITSGVSGHASGSLHLMYAELQVLSPLVPTREILFLRYCQQNVEEGSWAVVDFPIDSLQDNHQFCFPTYRRRPSGCIIQDMPNGYSRVTWVEHAEVENKPLHQVFNQYVTGGMAFGAQRWLAVLQRQCERFASLMARNISDLGVIPSPEARKNLMKLAQRMVRTFCVNVSTSGGQSWTALSDSLEDTVRITTRKNTEPGQPNGLILSAVSTTFLPFPHHQVFDLLRDEHRRSQLDVLSSGNSLHEVAHIANGSHPGNCISLLRINAPSNSAQNVELILQESFADPSGSLIVYTTVDVDAIQLAMSGDDPSYIPVLPVGFAILPVGPTDNDGSLSSNEDSNGQPSSGCLLTVGLQVLASTIPTAKLNLSSVTAITNHLCNAVHQINASLSSSTANSGSGSGSGGDGGGAETTAASD